MLAITHAWIAFKTDRRAVTAVEYAMMVGLFAAVLAATVVTFETSISKIFSSVALKV